MFPDARNYDATTHARAQQNEKSENLAGNGPLYIACSAICFCFVLIYKGLQNCCDVMQNLRVANASNLMKYNYNTAGFEITMCAAVLELPNHTPTTSTSWTNAYICWLTFIVFHFFISTYPQSANPTAMGVRL